MNTDRFKKKGSTHETAVTLHDVYFGIALIYTHIRYTFPPHTHSFVNSLTQELSEQIEGFSIIISVLLAQIHALQPWPRFHMCICCVHSIHYWNLIQLGGSFSR